MLKDTSDTDTLLNLNMPDTKNKITDGFNKAMADLPAPVKQQATETFTKNQESYASKVTHAFSDSLRSIFITAGGLMAVAVVLVFAVKERKLASASPEQTPGEA